MGGGSNGGQLISVYPEELIFAFELGKSCFCNIKVVNNTEHHVAFKVSLPRVTPSLFMTLVKETAVKTTSPKKYFVRPNTRVVQPWDSQIITVTLQAQSEYPSDMQCKDKFLIQSAIVPASTDIDEVPPNTFTKENDQGIQEHKLKVVYTTPGESSESGLASPSSTGSRKISDNLSVQRLKEEQDAALQQNQQLQQELEMLKKRKSRKNDSGFSLTFLAFAGAIGFMLGLILKLLSGSPEAEL